MITKINDLTFETDFTDIELNKEGIWINDDLINWADIFIAYENIMGKEL